MNLFEINARIAVKLGQSLDTLYNLEYMEYTMLLNIINKDVESENEKITEINKINESASQPFRVNLPSNLNIR